MNIVIDTNVIISGLCFPFGKPRQAFEISRKHGNILISTDTFNELKNALLRKKFDKYIELSLRLDFLEEYKKICNEFTIYEKILECRDEKDNKFLELAVNGEAEYIITGDSDLLSLNPFRNIKILTPDLFCSELLSLKDILKIKW
jgi:uncharacterized protein